MYINENLLAHFVEDRYRAGKVGGKEAVSKTCQSSRGVETIEKEKNWRCITNRKY